MPSSLGQAEVQAVLDRAVAAAGAPGGPWRSPPDWRDQTIYFLMVDRFNNPSAPPAHPPYDDPSYFGFQGGSFAGIEQQLGYLRDLGAGALWLSPVLKNLRFDPGSYHGYGIHDFLRAEPRFASDPARADDELRALVDAAHEAGLYVIFDIVLNHTGDVFAYQGAAQAPFQPAPVPVGWRDAQGTPHPEIPDASGYPNPPADAVVWPSELQSNRFFRRQGQPDPGGDDTLGDFASLKQMLTADPQLQQFLIRAYQYVIARFDVDGFRIDTLRYLKGDLPRLFGNAIREFALSIGKKNFFTFGEVLDGSEEVDIARFIGRNTSDQSTLVGVDAALDYPLFNVLKPIVKGFLPPSSLVAMYADRKAVEAQVLSSHGDATRYFVTFLDNHDMKERLRYVQPGQEHRYDAQVTLGLACLHALPGIPCIYYGTEQGLHGSGSDPAVREALWGLAPGFPQSGLFYAPIQAIAAVREAESALRYGRSYFRPISADGVAFGIGSAPGRILAWSRILNDQEVVVAANPHADLAQTAWVIVDRSLSVPGETFRVLYSNSAAPAAPGPVTVLGPVRVTEVDGSLGQGPVSALRVTLGPMEIQFLKR